MPSAPLRYCTERTFPPCPNKVERGKCDTHRKTSRRTRERYRGSAASRGYDHKWKKLRSAYLHANRLCVSCEAEDRVTEATVVDHITPHKGDKKLFYDEENWQSLCETHHNRKTATTDRRRS